MSKTTTEPEMLQGPHYPAWCDKAGKHGIGMATANLQINDHVTHTSVTAPLTASEALELAAVLTSYAHKIIDIA